MSAETGSPITTYFRVCDGGRVRFADNKAGSANTLLLLAPWPESLWAFRRIWDRISAVGRAVAIAYAREGADVAIVYLPQEQVDADETVRWVEQAGRVGGVRGEPVGYRTSPASATPMVARHSSPPTPRERSWPA